MTTQSIGLVGYGKFGQLLVKLLASWPTRVDLKIHSPSNQPDEQKFFSLEQVCASDTVIISVPIARFETIVAEAKNYFQPGSLVLDICSVKIHPKKVLLEYLAEDVDVLATHPNFGPESYRMNNNSTDGFGWIVDRVRCRQDRYNQFVVWLDNLGIHRVEMTAEDHDSKVGIPHFLSLFQGLLMNRLSLNYDSRWAAVSTKKMFEMAKGVGDDLHIARDMVCYNPFVADFLNTLSTEEQKLVEQLRQLVDTDGCGD